MQTMTTRCGQRQWTWLELIMGIFSINSQISCHRLLSDYLVNSQDVPVMMAFNQQCWWTWSARFHGLSPWQVCPAALLPWLSTTCGPRDVFCCWSLRLMTVYAMQLYRPHRLIISTAATYRPAGGSSIKDHTLDTITGQPYIRNILHASTQL